MAGGGMHRGGEGGCTCILCIPPGYATARRYRTVIMSSFGADFLVHSFWFWIELSVFKGYVEMTGVDSDTSQDIAEAISLKGGRYLSLVLYSAWGDQCCGTRMMKSDLDPTFQVVPDPDPIPPLNLANN